MYVYVYIIEKKIYTNDTISKEIGMLMYMINVK